MKRARIVLGTIILIAVFGGLTAFKVQRMGLTNLFYRTTGVFVLNGAGRHLTYATLSPYRTFQTSPTQTTVSVTMRLYTSTTWTTTTIGGWPYTYIVVTGMEWPDWLVYDDEGQ
ncbi:hypothetical protein SAMN05518672_1011031 [Chitinophaga sp. CF118]|uniref:hypothetical protein n=1 Tax=Chitinophaga sp. CF118 TaxID=1884367 RepID=UPI0008E681C2|nr:hypothetical protein [Chitinophaga sp. CF118]SFD20468.1 hypothetical protein SAMN05518672_1011031 [Chitinophaga sp. CF118]